MRTFLPGNDSTLQFFSGRKRKLEYATPLPTVPPRVTSIGTQTVRSEEQKSLEDPLIVKEGEEEPLITNFVNMISGGTSEGNPAHFIGPDGATFITQYRRNSWVDGDQGDYQSVWIRNEPSTKFRLDDESLPSWREVVVPPPPGKYSRTIPSEWGPKFERKDPHHALAHATSQMSEL